MNPDKVAYGSRVAAPFISRGDDSCMRKKELKLWPMRNRLALAGRGNFIADREKNDLAIVFEDGSDQLNPRYVTVINSARFPHVRYDLARKYIDFITGAEGQAVIRSFKKDSLALFAPDAVK